MGKNDISTPFVEAVLAATGELAISYHVGEKKFEKKSEATRYGKRMHQRGAFVVGDEKFENEMEARLALARQKFRSAVTAVMEVKSAQAEQDAELAFTNEG